MSAPAVVAVTVTLVGVFGASGAAIAAGGGASGRRASSPTPPVIREPFTPLPCTGSPGHRDTLQEEGCAEQQILRSDRRSNELARTIYSLLLDTASRRDFSVAQQAWLNYRKADCLSRSDEFRGGTLAGVLDAQCAAERSAERVRQLRSFQSDLRGHR
jgi:uncharacterized protein YecT (DUF1311 family)